ncbi:MAG: hypothetical protein QOJ03_82 [Frankiaceae bacterium]|nr:hypothetical protein [Frankiaceae bacterium]
MAFRGWPVEALEFYDGLQADNTKTYWQANKSTYEDKVRGPMVALLTELEPRWGAGKIFRPYRDVRFSADKTPYKTAIGALLAEGGYVQLSADGLATGCGVWHMESDDLKRYRGAVADDVSGADLVAVADALRGQGIGVISRESLKTVPRGYDRDHPRADLLRNKGLAAWKQWPVGSWLGTAKARARVEEFLTAAEPLRDWLRKHVG